MSMKHWIQIVMVAGGCLGLIGCVSQRSHEQALQELQASHEATTQEIERLQKSVEIKQVEIAQLQEENLDLEQAAHTNQATVAQLQETKKGLEQVVQANQTTVAQLQETKKELEQRIEVQDQIQEQQLNTVKKELETLYAQVLGLADPQKIPSAATPIFETGSVDFDDLNKAFQQVRNTLDAQVADFSQLRDQNRLLEQDLTALEVRLKDVERLKKELEQVRKAREIQEAQLAKVKHEVATVGGEIDRITKALEEKFGKSLVVTQHQDRLVLTMLGHVLFESGEADLTPLGLKIMKQVGQALAALPEKTVQVEGHTDNNPIYGQLQRRYPTNWELSTARATTVLRYLIEQTGMDRNQFAATGYADTRPVQSNATEEGRAQNRRVEIVLYPKSLQRESERVANLTPVPTE